MIPVERKIRKISNSFHVSIPDGIKKKLNLVEGQMAIVEEQDGKIIVTPNPKRG